MLKSLLNQHNIDHYNWIPLKEPVSFSHFEEWLKNDMHADMDYLVKAKDHMTSDESLYKKFTSALVVTADYTQHPHPEGDPFPSLKKSLYAKGSDYHFWFKQNLNKVIIELQKLYPENNFYAATDSLPILERDLAYQAGLGWFGKNTCLIHPKKGSLFFIGQILSDVIVETTKQTASLPHADRCGTCTRCIDACPTEALTDKSLDAKKCLAFWNIESKTTAPQNIQSKMSEWFFGCDICQTVCPWNQKVFKKEVELQSTAWIPNQNSIEELKTILTSSNKKLAKLTAQSPLSRARPFGLKRNALVLIKNYKIIEYKDWDVLIPEKLQKLNNEVLAAL